MTSWPLSTPAAEFAAGAPDEPIGEYVPGSALWVFCPCGRHFIVFDLRKGWTVTEGTTIADLTVTPAVRFPSVDVACRGHFAVRAGSLVEV